MSYNFFSFASFYVDQEGLIVQVVALVGINLDSQSEEKLGIWSPFPGNVGS